MLEPAMKIDLPDERVANMARFSLVRDMMTRVKDFPHYGAFDKDYFGSEHEGFPDTFHGRYRSQPGLGLGRSGRTLYRQLFRQIRQG